MQAVLSKEDMGQQLGSCTPAKHLDQLAAFVTEHIEVAAVRVSRERFLHQQDPASACRDACRCGQSQSTPARPTQWGSPRRPSAKAATATFSVAASAVPVIRIRAPAANSISIAPPPTRIHHFKPFELETAPIAVHRDSSQQHASFCKAAFTGAIQIWTVSCSCYCKGAVLRAAASRGSEPDPSNDGLEREFKFSID